MPDDLITRIRAARTTAPLDSSTMELAEKSPVAKQDTPRTSTKIPSWLKTLMAANPVANIADIVTTEQALDRGGVEANPIMASKLARWGLKPALSVGTTYGAYQLAKRGKIKEAALLLALSTIPPAAAAIHNSRVNR